MNTNTEADDEKWWQFPVLFGIIAIPLFYFLIHFVGVNAGVFE